MPASSAYMRLTHEELASIFEAALDYSDADMVGADAVLDFFDIPTGDSFDVAPNDAIALFKAKKLKPTFSYADMLGKAHAQAFTVAKMMDVDMLGQVRTSLESAMANGTPFKEWADGLIPMLQGSGWWGRKEVVDPLTGKTVVAQLGSPHRLETIFRTNMQMAYAEQHWEMIDSQKDVAPYLLYDAVDDFRTRPAHKARDGVILPVDHAWWGKNTPPLGYNCRCGVIQLSDADLEALGKFPNKKPPDLGTYEWKNPRTGIQQTFPEGIDPGFDYNVGRAGLQSKLDKLIREKIQTLPPDMETAAKKSLINAPTIAAAATGASMSSQAADISTAALERASAASAATESAMAAEKMLRAIDRGEGDYRMSVLRLAYRQLKERPNFRAKSPIDQLVEVYRRAQEIMDRGR